MSQSVEKLNYKRELPLTAVVDHLSNLIRIPSVSTLPNRPITNYASAILTAHSWTIREIPYDDSAVEKVNLIAAPPGQNVADRIVDLAFLCHTDTVPYAEDWPQALKPVLNGKKLHGCGACDVKGFLACLLAAVESPNAQWRHGLRIVLTADEEIGCIGSKRLIEADSLRPRRVVVGEPTSLRTARAGKGYSLARVTILGREAHSALPDQGVSAIFTAAHFISALEKFSQKLATTTNDFFEPGFTTLNVGTIVGGTAKNIIPGRVDLVVEWRPIPGLPPEQVPGVIRELLERLQVQYPGTRGSLTVLRQQIGFETAANCTLVKSLEKVTGQPAMSIAFGSEASNWSAIAEDVVVFGPGDMRSAHSSRECVSTEELAIATQAITHLMQTHSTTE
jgi:acetylornithine deacetylase